MNMQKHSAFARIEARDLSPAAPPATPGSETKKSKRQQTARSTTKPSSATLTTPEKSNNLPSQRKVDGNGSDVVSPGNVTPVVSKCTNTVISQWVRWNLKVSLYVWFLIVHEVFFNHIFSLPEENRLSKEKA